MPKKLNDFQFKEMYDKIERQKLIINIAKNKMKAILLEYDLTVQAYNHRKRTNDF